MSRLSELAVAKRSVTLLLAGALFIAGISAWNGLQQELLPDIDFPVITVVAPLPGASATDVASQVAEPIERAISGVPRLENLQSTSANSVALVIAQFAYGTDVKAATTAINENVRIELLHPHRGGARRGGYMNQPDMITATATTGASASAQPST